MDLTSTVENVKCTCCTCIKLIYLSLGTFAIVCLGLEKKDKHFKRNICMVFKNVIKMEKETKNTVSKQ